MRGKNGKFSAAAELRICRVEGCSNPWPPKASLGYCNMHYLRLRRNGTTDPLPPKPPKVRRCRVDDCGLEVHKNKLCKDHYRVQQASKIFERKQRKCTAPGCNKVVECKDLCATHYQRLRKRGTIDGPIKPSRDWGGASEHPLHLTWRRFSLRAERSGDEICERWSKDFWNFVADMGTRPTRAHTLIRIDEKGPYSPDNCTWATADQRHAVQMKVVPLSTLINRIVMPGIEQHLTPLALYRGTKSLGRIHRMWNFVLAMMETECSSFTHGIVLSHNEDYAQLCGPEAKLQHSQLYSFFSRLRLNPKVTDNVEGLTEYTADMMPVPFALQPVPINSIYRNCAPWRNFKPPTKMRQRTGVGANITESLIKTADVSYPYVVWERNNPVNHLTQLVHQCVPRGLPDEMRADVCQDLIVDILAGDLSEDMLIASPRKYVNAKLGAHRFGGRFGDRPLETELIDILQHDEAKRRFDDYVDNELSGESSDGDEGVDEFAEYIKESLGDKYRITQR